MLINEEQFEKIYTGFPVIEYKHIFFSGVTPKNDLDYYRNFLSSKLWRMNNLYTIVDKHHNVIPFKMKYHQHQVFVTTHKHDRIIILKSRQLGCSTLALISFFDDCLFNSNFQVGLMSYGLAESSELLKKIRFLWESLSPIIKQWLCIKLETNNQSKLVFSNGSTILIQRSFRGGTLHGFHISEFGKIAEDRPDYAIETIEGSLQTLAPGSSVIMESTAEGANMFKDIWDRSVALPAPQRTYKDFLPLFIPWIDDETCMNDVEQIPTKDDIKYFDKLEIDINRKLLQEQKNFYIAARRELGENVSKEYPGTPKEAFVVSNKAGAIYAKQYQEYIKDQGRVCTGLYDPNIDVQVAVDIGLKDLFVLIFFQYYNGEIRIINDYTNSRELIEHYARVMDEKSKKYGYRITHLILPHDSSRKTTVTFKDPESRFRDEGYTNITKLDCTSSVASDIEAVRTALKTMWIDPNCKYVIGCLKNYKRSYDKKRKTYRDKPIPNDWAHGADTLRYIVAGLRKYSPSRKRYVHRITNTTTTDV